MAAPRLAITPGEPAGIGPDIVLRAAQEEWPAQLVAIADIELLSQRAQTLGIAIELQEFSPESAPVMHVPGTLLVDSIRLASKVEPGVLNPANSHYVLETLQRAIALCSEDICQAMVTGPVQKSVINEAGVNFSGHTEFLQEHTHTPEVVMMLATSELRVALATTHLALQDVPSAITPKRLTDTLRILHNDLLNKFVIDNPCIAVLGLNPHAGEDGHMGREEIDTIIPVLEQLRGEGMNLLGPLPADTAFNPKVLDRCDAVFAMYHDQGLPVLKYSGFGQAINITLGLPIIRTSVDHGTALDLAGTGEADWRSLGQAINIAAEMAR